jgi:hypothetical protein
MPRLHANIKSEIEDAVAAGLKPLTSTRGGIRLPLGNGKHILLINSSGKETPAGEFYYATHEEKRPRGPFDQTQQLIQRKNKDYIKVLGSTRPKLVRTYNEGSKKYTFTRLGERFFADRHVRYNVQVPLSITAPLSSDPTPYTACNRSTMVASAMSGMPPLTVDDRLTPAEKKRAIIKIVTDHIESIIRRRIADGASEPYLLRADSKQKWYYDPRGEMELMPENVVTRTGASSVESSTVRASASSTVFRAADVRPGLHPVIDIDQLEVSLNGIRMNFGEEILDPAPVCTEAFEESDDNCVLTQLCAVFVNA